MKTILFTGCIAVLVPLGACQKNKTIEADPAKVAIGITSPIPGAIYRSGDTIRIQGRVSYPAQMHGYELKLIDSASGMILYDDAKHVHGDNFAVDDYWIGTASVPITVKLSLVASIDHDGGAARHEFNFSVRP